MKNSKGFLKVFKFSYKQALKSKSTRITIMIFVIIGLLFFPVKTLITKGFSTDDGEKGKLNTVYVETDDENLYQCITSFVDDEAQEEVEFIKADRKDYDKTIEEFKNSEENLVYVQVNFNEALESQNFGISYKLIYSNGENSEEAADKLFGIIYEGGKDIVLKYYGIPEEQGKTLGNSDYEISRFDAEGNEITDDSGLNNTEYWFTYGIIMALIILVSFAGSLVAEGIVSEKANRVIEYIMVNLKPLDLILGKIMSGIAVLFTMVASVLAAFTVSSVVNKAFIDEKANTIIDIIKSYTGSEVLKGFNIINFIIAILIIVAGVYFYGIIGGLCGGMVSKVEEMGEGLKVYTILMIIGAYLSMGMCISSNAVGSGWGSFAYVVYLLPISSMFIVPSYLLLGKMSVWIAIGSLTIVLVCCVLLTLLAARVFGQMLYHNGSPMKLKDVIAITKKSKAEQPVCK